MIETPEEWSKRMLEDTRQWLQKEKEIVVQFESPTVKHET